MKNCCLSFFFVCLFVIHHVLYIWSLKVKTSFGFTLHVFRYVLLLLLFFGFVVSFDECNICKILNRECHNGLTNCLHNWRWCRFSFSPKFIRMAFTACWMERIPSSDRWDESCWSRSIHVSQTAMGTTFQVVQRKKDFLLTKANHFAPFCSKQNRWRALVKANCQAHAQIVTTVAHSYDFIKLIMWFFFFR